MATLYFKVSSDYDEVIRLRQECEKLEAQLKKMDVNKSPVAAKALETQLASTRQQMMGLVTEAAKAGAVMENDLKKKLNSASNASDELTEEIIKQRKIIRDTQDDVRRLSEEYSKMGKYSPNSKAKLAELNIAKAALNEQRYSLGELQDQQARNRLEVRKLTREYKEFARGTNSADEIVKSLTDSLKRTAVEIGGLVAIKKFGSDVIDATGRMQQLQVALSTILQDKSKANQLVAEIIQFAAKTPFNLDDVANGAKQLLAYGSSADKVVGELSMLGDVASGLQIPIGQLIYLYGTLRTQGRAMTVDIRQFAGRGIPIYEELAKVLGVSKDQVGELVKGGKVGFKEVEQAFKNMTSEGGKFANLMESSAGTWPQRLSNIEDTLFQKMNEFGNKYKEIFEFGIGTAEDLVESLDDVLSVMGGLIAAYGTYKAALITAAVAQKAVGFVESIRLIGMYRKELGLATATQKAFNLAAKSNVYVALLSAIVGIGTAIYMFTKRTKEATAAQEALNSINKKADEEFSKQAASVDRLTNVLKSETSSLDQKKKALSELQAIIPSYNASLNEEGRLINNNTEAIKSYLVQLEKQIRMKAVQEELEELYRNKRLQEKDVQSKQADYETVKSQNPIGVVYGGDVGVEAQRHALNRISSAEKALNKANKELENTQLQIEALEKEIEKSSLSDEKELALSTISKEIEDTTQRIKTLKQEIADLRNGKIQAEVGKTVESVILAKEKELQSAEKTLETLTGIRRDKASEEPQKRLQLANELLQLRFQNQQAEINLMKEGTDKKIAQINLDFEKERDSIRENARKWAKEQGGMLTTEQTVQVSTAYSNAKSKRDQGVKGVKGEAALAGFMDMAAYLKEYGDYQEKRLALTLEYNKKIEDSVTEGERSSLKKELEKSLHELDFSQFKDSINFADVFGNLDEQTTDALVSLKEKLSTYINEAAKDLSPEDLKELQDAFNKITFEITDRKPFMGLQEGMDEYKVAQENVRQAQGELNKVLSGGEVITGLYEDENGKLVKRLLSLEQAERNVAVAQSGRQKAMAKMSQALNSIGENGKMAIEGSNALTSMLSDLGVNMPEDLSKSLDGIGQVFEGLSEIDITKPFSIVTSSMKMIGGLGKTIGGLFGGKSKAERDSERLEKVTSKIANTNEVINNLIDKRIDLIKEATAAEREGLKQSSLDAIERQKQIMEAEFSKLLGNELLGKRGKNNDLDVRDLGINSIKDLAEFLQSDRLVELMEDGYGITDKDKWMSIVNEWEKLNEQADQLKETVSEVNTGITFDEAKNGLDDLLLSADTTFEDIADNFEGYMRQSILSMVKSNYLNKEMEKWYNQFDQRTSDGSLSANDVDVLRGQYESMYQNAQDKINQMLSAAGIGLESSETGQQGASGRGFGTEMTHEDAGELSGRFTAVYESNIRVETAVHQQTVAITELKGSISALTAQASGLYNIADETRTILVESYIELQQINENTGQSARYLKDIKADIAEVKRSIK